MRDDRDVTPLPVDPDARDVLLFGGSFDPPHWGHFELPILVQVKLREALGLPVWLVYVPAARSPHKDQAPNASPEDRVAMLQAGLEGTREIAIWTDEIDRARGRDLSEEPSFWIETLQLAREKLPNAAMRFLIGSDQAISFHKWYKPRECIDVIEPLVMLRKHVESREWLVEQIRNSGYWSDEELLQWHARVVELPIVEVSSTQAREELLKQPRDEKTLREMLHAKVLKTIEDRDLYKA